MKENIIEKKRVHFKGDPSPVRSRNIHKKTKRQFYDTNEYHLENRTNHHVKKPANIVPEHKYSTRHKTNMLRKHLKMAQIPIKKRHTEGLLSWSELMERRGEIDFLTRFHSYHSYDFIEIDSV